LSEIYIVIEQQKQINIHLIFENGMF